MGHFERLLVKIHGGIELDNVEHGHLIGKVSSYGYMPEVDHCVSRSIDDALAGGVIYQNYTKASITLHVASWHKRWLSRDLLWTIFAYPFLLLGVKKCLGFVPTTNEAALAFDKHIGFEEEHRILDAVPDGDLVILSMRKENCRWLQIAPPRGFLRAVPPPRPRWQETFK